MCGLEIQWLVAGGFTSNQDFSINKCGWLFPSFSGGNQSFNFQDLAMWNAVALIFVRHDFVEGFEIVEVNGWKFCPLRFRFQARPKLPFAGVSRGGNQTSLAIFGGLTPFVFLHDSCRGIVSPRPCAQINYPN